MSITLDDVSCLMHLSIRGRLLDHGRIIRDEAVEMMVTYLGSDLGDSMKEVEDTLRCHARFIFLDRLYNQQYHRPLVMMNGLCSIEHMH